MIWWRHLRWHPIAQRWVMSFPVGGHTMGKPCGFLVVYWRTGESPKNHMNTTRLISLGWRPPVNHANTMCLIPHIWWLPEHHVVNTLHSKDIPCENTMSLDLHMPPNIYMNTTMTTWWDHILSGGGHQFCPLGAFFKGIHLTCHELVFLRKITTNYDSNK